MESRIDAELIPEVEKRDGEGQRFIPFAFFFLYPLLEHRSSSMTL